MDDLTLYYIKNDIYNPASCRDKNINNNVFVLCSAVSASNSGGLYLVNIDKENFTIFALNGKAIQHSEYMFGVKPIYNADIDIPYIMSKF